MVILNYIICFSQDRNSYNIVVYFNNKYELTSYSNHFWNNAKYFDYDQYHAIVDYIYEVASNEKIAT